MKLGQIFDPQIGICACVIEGNEAIEMRDPGGRPLTVLGLIERASAIGISLSEAALQALSLRHGREVRAYALADISVPPRADGPYLTLPVHSPEVWACGVTYRPSADFRDEDARLSKGIYDQVYISERPEIFFKATAARCVGPNDGIGRRQDSRFTAPEPELALVLDQHGKILGYTICNDVSAWDIERENPLYLPQSKVYLRCCALGPFILTSDEVKDPRSLKIACRILRGSDLIFEGSTTVAQMKRSFDELVRFLMRCNPIPDGTVYSTGTGIIVQPDAALEAGDIVEITVEPIGTLRNPVVIV